MHSVVEGGRVFATDRDLPGARITLAILVLLYILSIADRQLIALVVDPIRTSLHLTTLQMGLLQGLAFTAVYSLSVLPVGWMVDRLNRRRLLAAGLCTWSIATIVTGFAQNFEQMFLARMVVGVGEAIMVPVALSFIADMFCRRHLGRANSVFSAASGVGGGVALAVGGTLIVLLNSSSAPLPGLSSEAWRSAFRVCGFAGLVVAPLIVLIRDPRGTGPLPRPEPGRGDWREFGAFLKRRRVAVGCHFASFVLIGCAVFSYTAWGPRFLMNVHGWTPDKVGLIMGAIIGIGSTSGIIFGGIMIDRLTERGWKVPYFDVPVIALALGAPLVAATFLVRDGTAAGLLFGVGVTLLCGYSAGCWASLQLMAPAEMRGRLAALYVATLGIVGAGIGPLAAPLLARWLGDQDGGMGLEIALSILLFTAIAAVMLRLGREPLRQAIEAEQPASIG